MLIIIIISVLILPISAVSINNNSAKYLHQANEILQGQEQTLLFPEFKTTRGPIFPMLLVMAFKFGGKSVQSASVMTRAFFSLGIISVYLLGRILYGRREGVLASLLVMTSSGINLIAQGIDTDIVLPFFVILFTLFYYISIDHPSRVWAIAAGVSLGAAFMVKESALLSLGLPLGMVIFAPQKRRSDYIKTTLWILGAMVATLLPWAIKIAKTYGSLLPILGVAHPELLKHSSKTLGFNSILSYWIYLFTIGAKNAFYAFHDDYLKNLTILSPLMIVGSFFLFLRAWFLRKKNDLVLIISVVCLMPLILRVADTRVRLGQLTIVYMILYIAVATISLSAAIFLVDQITRVKNKYPRLIMFRRITISRPIKTKNQLTILIGISLISGQLFLQHSCTFKQWTRGEHALAIFTNRPFKVYGRFTIEQQKATEWLKNNTSKNEKIIADGYTHEALDFYGAADYQIPLFHPCKSISIDHDTIEKRKDNVKPIYFITYSNFEKGSIYPIFEDEIIMALKKENPDYLVLSGRSLFFESYFNKAKWAELKFSKFCVRIYRIHTNRIDHVVLEDIGVNETINEHIDWLEKNYSGRYLLFKEKVNLLGFTLDELKTSRLRFPPGEVY